MFIHPSCKSNSLENDSLLTQIGGKYRSNMERFDPRIQIRNMMPCERFGLSSDQRLIHVVGEADFKRIEQSFKTKLERHLFSKGTRAIPQAAYVGMEESLSSI